MHDHSSGSRLLPSIIHLVLFWIIVRAYQLLVASDAERKLIVYRKAKVVASISLILLADIIHLAQLLIASVVDIGVGSLAGVGSVVWLVDVHRVLELVSLVDALAEE